MKIITHGGRAHLDDLMAVATFLAGCAYEEMIDSLGELTPEKALEIVADDFMVLRRDPTVEELDDRTVCVIDVGGRYEPEKLNFDHHQLTDGNVSAMTLVAQDFTIPDGERYVDTWNMALEELYPWFKCRAEVDQSGPFKAAKARGLEWSQVEEFLGPCEGILLRMFEDSPKLIALKLAEEILGKVLAYSRVAGEVNRYRVNEVPVLDFTASDPEAVRLVSDAFVRQAGEGVAVFHDDRGEGLTLLRIHDDPRVDFTRVTEDPEVLFAHKGGFIAKTKSKDLAEAKRLITAAVKARP